MVEEIDMAEENCCTNSIFPKCPKCGKGVLVPFSFKEDVFEKWQCTECEFVLEKKRRER